MGSLSYRNFVLRPRSLNLADNDNAPALAKLLGLSYLDILGPATISPVIGLLAIGFGDAFVIIGLRKPRDESVFSYAGMGSR